MDWKRTRITLNVWQAGDYRIVENPEAMPHERFRLEVFPTDGEEVEPQLFPTLDAAKRTARTLNELALVKADNERLRIELSERRQADAFATGAASALSARKQPPPAWENADDDFADDTELEHVADDGRGIPIQVA